MSYEEGVTEIEVVDSKLDAPRKESKPTKTKDDHSKAIRFFGVFTSTCFSLGFPGLLLSLLAGLAFAILYSQGSMGQLMLVLMIVSFSLAAAFLLALILGFIGRAFLRKTKEKDPNFEDSVNDDSAF